MRIRFRGIVVMVSLVLGACASAGGTTRRHAPNTITREEIEDYRGENAYLLIQSLHSNWLRARGPQSLTLTSGVAVYVDSMEQPDGVESLKRLRPQEVQEITYLDSRAATNRFGTGHSNGAILVTLRGAGR